MNNIDSQIPPAVDAFKAIRLEGNVIPATWYQVIKTKEDKPDLIAITVLADIVYWYRPTELRDEDTGHVIGYKKKFSADKLQRGYGQLADQFGISKEQARDACHRLEKMGLITIEIRHGVRYGNNFIANNVIYLEPVADVVLGVSFKDSQGGIPTLPSPPSDVDTNTGISSGDSSDIVGETPDASELPSEDEIIAQDEQSPESDTVSAWNALQSASQTLTDLSATDEALILLCDTDKLLTRTRFKKDHKSRLGELLECDPTREALDNARDAFRKAIIEGKAFSAPAVFLGYYATAVDTLRIRSPMYDQKTREFYRPVPQQAVYANDGVDF